MFKKVDPDNPVYSRALEVRLYPDSSQENFLRKTIGCIRKIYNLMLNERKEVYTLHRDDEEVLKAHKYRTEREWKNDPEFEYLKEVDSVALQQARMNLDTAYKNFFESLSGKRRGKAMGFPVFKRKSSGGSFRTLLPRIKLDSKTIRLPKLKNNIPFRANIPDWARNAKAASITVKLKPSGKWFASILFDVPDTRPKVQIPENPRVIGLDMSLTSFFVDSDGNSPKDFKKQFQDKKDLLAKRQRQMAKKVLGSKNREKARAAVARIHERIANSRKNFLHQTSRKIVDSNDVIVTEDLNLDGMKKLFGKSVADVSWGTFVSMLTYKATRAGKALVKADRFFASSKTCHACGSKNKNLTIADREWTCHKCGVHHDRDHNAAINLRQLIVPAEGRESTPIEMDTSLGLPRSAVDEVGNNPGGTARKISHL